jgi:hypothetical protein
MIGICSESFVWISHFFFTVSRVRPKLNLRKLIIRNKHFLNFEIYLRRIKFMKGAKAEERSLFIDILIKKIIIEWCFILFVSCFIYIISEVRINYNYDEDPDIRMFISIFYFYIYQIRIYIRKF